MTYAAPTGDELAAYCGRPTPASAEYVAWAEAAAVWLAAHCDVSTYDGHLHSAALELGQYFAQLKGAGVTGATVVADFGVGYISQRVPIVEKARDVHGLPGVA